MVNSRPRQLPSGRVVWRVQYRLDGKVKTETFDSAEAGEKFAQTVNRVGGEAATRTRQARDTNEKKVLTLEDWTAEYLSAKSGLLTGITPSTRAEYAKIADRSFLQVLGAMPLNLITKQEVARWVIWQEDQPSSRYLGQRVSAKTVRNYHGLLSSVLSAAVDHGHMPANTARGTKLARGLRENVTFLTLEEFNRIRDAMPERYRALASWLVWTGMRWGEATALTWDDISISGGIPVARVTKAWKRSGDGGYVIGPPKTRKSVRTVGVLPQVLQELGVRRRPGDLVFQMPQTGGRVSSQRFHASAWQPVLRRLNEPNVEGGPLGKWPRVHDLRHSHASWLIGDGAPLHYVQARLGHEKITTTVDVYGHLLPDADLQLSKIMQARMETAMPLALGG